MATRLILAMPIRIPTGSEHLELVNVYRRSLRTDTIDTIIDRTLCQETCFCVDLATRRSIADSVFKFFKITNAELNFVGSAQLGFSLLQKGDRPRYRAFSIESDLDIAIVSSSFFDEVWESTFVHFIEKRPWPLLQDFQKYFFRGWIRPDKLPYVTQFRSSWFDFFRNLSREQFDSQHSITCGLYKSNTFLREYHKKAVRERLGAEEINDKNSANEPQD